MADAELIRCPACGATNRVLRSRIDQGQVPVCGRCKALLSITGRPVAVTDATFSTMVEQSPIPVLLDMWAEWCQPCHMMALGH